MVQVPSGDPRTQGRYPPGTTTERLAHRLLNLEGMDPARVWERPHVERRRRRTGWPLPRLKLLPSPEEARARFEEVAHCTVLSVLGATPLAMASCSVGPDGTMHLCRGHAHVTLKEQGGLQTMEGVNPALWVRAVAELAPDGAGGWGEILSEVTRYARRSDLERDALPRHRRAVRVHPDGRRVDRSFERILDAARDQERLVRATRLWRPDGTWAEEVERLFRVGDRVKVEMARREGLSPGEAPRAFRYDYPWLPAASYQRARQRILAWITP
ncbi:MAG: hypothetical protein KC933_15635 [Myxococcales bacterium]|nr:hypothetical protein [Myxococcales bacterium]